MNTQLIINILILVGILVIIVGIGFGLRKFFDWIKPKIKNEKLKAVVEKLDSICVDAVKKAYQTTVEALKDAGNFDKEAQVEIKNKVLQEIASKCTEEINEYIAENKINLGDKIEAVIYDLKQKGGSAE